MLPVRSELSSTFIPENFISAPHIPSQRSSFDRLYAMEPAVPQDSSCFGRLSNECLGWLKTVYEVFLQIFCCKNEIICESLSDAAKAADRHFRNLQNGERSGSQKLLDFWKLAYFLSLEPSDAGKEKILDSFRSLTPALQRQIEHSLERTYRSYAEQRPENEREEIFHMLEADSFTYNLLATRPFDALVIQALQKAYYANPRTVFHLAMMHPPENLRSFRQLLELPPTEEMDDLEMDRQIIAVWDLSSNLPKNEIYTKIRQENGRPAFEDPRYGESFFYCYPRSEIVKRAIDHY